MSKRAERLRWLKSLPPPTEEEIRVGHEWENMDASMARLLYGATSKLERFWICVKCREIKIQADMKPHPVPPHVTKNLVNGIYHPLYNWNECNEKMAKIIHEE